MKSCLQILAGIVAFIFVITAVFALFTVNLVRVVTDREAMKAVLGGFEELIRDATPSFISEMVQEQTHEAGLEAIELDEAQISAAMDDLIPRDWFGDQTDAAIDGFYNFLETGDISATDVEIDARPIFERLQGPEGEQFITLLVETLPPCTEPVPELDLESGNVNIPGCIPPGVEVAQLVGQVHTAVVNEIENNPEIMEAGVIQVPLFNEPGAEELTPSRRAQLQQLQRRFLLARDWSWLLWLLPAGCLLLILLLAVRSVSGWGHWWGWPLVVTAVTVLLLALVIPSLAAFLMRGAFTSSEFGSLAVPARRFVQDFFDTATDLWLSQVYLQAGIMLAAGVVLILIGFITRAAQPKQPALDVDAL